jgi:hypothetical protein
LGGRYVTTKLEQGRQVVVKVVKNMEKPWKNHGKHRRSHGKTPPVSSEKLEDVCYPLVI